MEVKEIIAFAFDRVASSIAKGDPHYDDDSSDAEYPGTEEKSAAQEPQYIDEHLFLETPPPAGSPYQDYQYIPEGPSQEYSSPVTKIIGKIMRQVVGQASGSHPEAGTKRPL
ncbi:hypothetical protein DSO57_1030724 [Entomophthora muscae]|uniref:Uncharacterized protein n=1 Tax=Entomophthora muscae TaxID=34485 RepID=A0ACC2RFF0_9FUNG|nr:hypothetical protein DSO57_1030724 [Entomophthora muscae]